MIKTELLDSETGVYYKVDEPQAQDLINVTSNTPNAFEVVTVVRSVAEVSIETDLRICMTTRNPVPAGSHLTIVYPSDQAIVSGTQIYRATSTSNTNL